VCVASDAQARRRHHGYWGGEQSYGERSSSRSSLDAWRRARDAQGQDQDQNQNQGQTRGQDQVRGQTGTPSPSQNLGPGRAGDRNLGQDLRRERWSYRSRYERRRGRSVDEWRRAQERGQESGQASGRASADVPRSRDEWRRVRDDERRAREERRAAERAPLTAATAAGASAAALPRGRSGPFGAI